MKKLLVLMLAVTMYSCFGTTQPATTTNGEEIPTADSITPYDCDGTLIEVNADSVRFYLAGLTAVRDSVETLLMKAATPEQADSIFAHRPKFEYLQQFNNLHNLIGYLIDRYCFGSDLLESDSVIIRMLGDAGFELCDIGEGWADLQPEQYYDYNLYGKYLSESAREYFRLWSDNNTLYQADAALAVRIDTLYSRCLKWEEYVGKYPGSPWQRDITDAYHTYMSDIMFCNMGNTRTFWTKYDDNDNVIGMVLEDIDLDQRRKLKLVGRGTMTHKIITKYLATLSKQDYMYSDELETNIMKMCEWMSNIKGPEDIVAINN